MMKTTVCVTQWLETEQSWAFCSMLEWIENLVQNQILLSLLQT